MDGILLILAILLLQVLTASPALAVLLRIPALPTSLALSAFMAIMP